MEQPDTPVLPHAQTPCMPCALILFDIDGTLLSLRGAGKRAFSQALHATFGWDEDLEGVSFAGATDQLVLRQVFERRGYRPSPDALVQFFEQLPLALEETVSSADPVLYPGTRDLLVALAAEPTCLLGLVTGNIRACGLIKLRQFGLEHYFAMGGFGDDHHDRNQIARVAVARAAEALGAGRAITRIALVGDAVSDVVAAHSIGAQAIAVMTGSFGRVELEGAGAHHVFDDLSQTEQVIAALGLGFR